MAYTPTTWADGTTPVDASRLNNVENGLVDHDSRLDDAETNITTLEDGTYKLADAAGDMLYATAADVLAKLAMGAANGNKKLFANAGGSAPEWATGFKTGSITRDLTSTTPSVATTGIGFKPNFMIFIMTINGQFQFGIYACTATASIGVFSSAAGIHYSSAGIKPYIDGSNYQNATLSTFDADGFTLSWSKTGSPTGTATINYIAIR